MTDGERALFVAGAGVDTEVIPFTVTGSPLGHVVLVHGWGDEAATLTPLARRFVERGYAATSMSMRGFGRSVGVDDCGLRQPADVVAVVRWARAQTGPEVQLALVGISQGGQVALLAAASGADVAAVAAWAPVTDVSMWRETTDVPPIRDYIDATCRDGDFTSRSPLQQAAGLASTPVLLVHGTADTRVPTEQSVLLRDAITAAGGTCELELLDGVGHSRHRGGNELAFAATTDFLARQLGQTSAP